MITTLRGSNHAARRVSERLWIRVRATRHVCRRLLVDEPKAGQAHPLTDFSRLRCPRRSASGIFCLHDDGGRGPDPGRRPGAAVGHGDTTRVPLPALPRRGPPGGGGPAAETEARGGGAV